MPKAPAALTTAFARTSQSRPAGRPFRRASSEAVVGSPARQASPVARPFSVRTRCTWTPARTRAPAFTARGR